MSDKKKLIRVAAVPQSLKILLKGQLKFLNQYYEVIGVSSQGELLSDVMEDEGIRVKDIEISRKINLIKDLKSLFKLYRFFKKEQPTIVHSITPKAGLLSMIAAKFAGVPIRMHTFTGLIWPTRTGFMRLLLMKMDTLTCWAATNVYPEGQGVKSDLAANNITSKPLKVIANGNVNGIDIKEFNPKLVSIQSKQINRKELGITDSDFIFLFVGRVVTDKGVNELVEAFIEVNKKYENTHLVLVGKYENHLDPLLPETEKHIETHTNIHAVGYKKNVVEYFGMADVLTFPSYREGFPNVVMQAAAMQLNAIVTNINGCNEIITNGENGWVIPVKNVEELKARMIWCLSNPSKSKEMGLKSRKLMIDKYERSFVQHELLKEYQSLLKKIDSL